MNANQGIRRRTRHGQGRPSTLAAIILAGLAAVGQAQGATASSRWHYVATNGNDAWPGTAAQPLRTIQRAVDVAAPGDTVIVRDGTYSGPGNAGVAWRDKDLAILSASRNRDACRVECNGANGFSFFDSEVDGKHHVISFSGLTIAHADTAISVTRAASPPFYGSLVDLLVANCAMRDGAYGIHAHGGDMDLQDVRISGNTKAGIAGGWYCGLTVSDSSIRGNGTGIYLTQLDGASPVVLSATEIVGNGIGMSYWQESSGMTMKDCRVDSSTTGDGIRCATDFEALTMEDCHVRGNARHGVASRMSVVTATRCDLSGNGGSGIAISGYESAIRLDTVTLVGNQGWGLGPYVGQAADFVIPDGKRREPTGARKFRRDPASFIEVVDSDLRGNAMGGLDVDGVFGPIMIARTSLTGNGGVGLRLASTLAGATCTVAGVTIAGNDGSGIVASMAQWSAVRTLVADNSGVAIDLTGSSAVSLSCTDLYGNQAGDWTAPLAAQAAVDGNLSVDPLFCDGAGGDYSLQIDSPLAAENNAACGTIGRFAADCPAQPGALFTPAVQDVPNDQGGHLNIVWRRHTLDAKSTLTPITSYEVQRRIAGWQTIRTVAAAAADTYATVIDTPDILTQGLPAPMSAYRVVAKTANPAITFASVPDSSCSVDNLPPPRPIAVLADGADFRLISWEEPGITDLASACVFRGDHPGFTADTPILCPDTPTFSEPDLGWYYYRVRFTDTHGNASAFSDEMRGRYPTAAPGTPAAAFMLYPCRPNPFNPSTVIRFDLPVDGMVRLSVYDVSGRLVRRLVDESLPGGTHEAIWDGRDVSGRGMPSGSYMARIEFGGRTRTTRLGLVR
jgi:hypothetical protein